MGMRTLVLRLIWLFHHAQKHMQVKFGMKVVLLCGLLILVLESETYFHKMILIWI